VPGWSKHFATRRSDAAGGLLFTENEAEALAAVAKEHGVEFAYAPRTAATDAVFEIPGLVRAIRSLLDEDADKRMAAVAKQWAALRRRRVWRGHSGKVRPASRETTGGVLEIIRSQVFSVAVFPDGNRVVSGSYDSTLKLWDVATGQCLATWEGHSHWVRRRGVLTRGVLLLALLSTKSACRRSTASPSSRTATASCPGR